MTVQFPEGFRFGTATAAFQIEGAARADGKQDSIWDVFCREPGRVVNGDDGTVACDHFHLYESDVDLMAQLGMSTYRFSVSWPRVYNDGAVNDKGMDFYSRLVDALLEKGIAPWLTLYHWDLPAALPGGWTNRDTAYRFADYAAAVHQRLGDRVATWTTMNEPWCSAFLGYASGVHAPGQTDPSASIRAAHHLLLGHGLATQALRAADPRAKLGITLNFTPVLPSTHDPADIDVARRIDGTSNRFFADAIFKGRYPGDVVADAGEFWPDDLVVDGDLDVISTPIDVLGVNYYTTNMFADGSALQAPPSPHVTAPTAVQKLRDLPLTDMGWEVEPSGLTRLLVRLHQDYTGPAGTEVVITENGAAFADRADANGFVDDSADRLEYLRRHLLAAHQAIEAGVNLRGYLVWSLMDNFEWAWGYGKRFGIVRVDEKLRRIPKASARWYAEVARTGAVPTVPPPPPDDALPIEDEDVPADEPTIELDGGAPSATAPQAMTAVPPPSAPQTPQVPHVPQVPQLPRSPWSADLAPGVEMAVPPPSVPQPTQAPPAPQVPPVPQAPQLPRSPWSADVAPGAEMRMAVPPPSVPPAPQTPQAPPAPQVPPVPQAPQLPRSPWSADVAPGAEMRMAVPPPSVLQTPQAPQLPRSPWSADPAPGYDASVSAVAAVTPHLPASPWSAELPASMELPDAAAPAVPASPWSDGSASRADTDATVIQLIYSRTPPESPASSVGMR